MGKPHKQHINLSLTEDIIREACEIVGAGNFRYVAAGRLGIPLKTWNSWVKRGKNELEDYRSGNREELTLKAQFVTELEQAEARCHYPWL